MSKLTNLEIAAQCWCDEKTSHTVMDTQLAEAFVKRLDEKDKTIIELQELAIWMTGCGFDFTELPYFCAQRDKLLKE